MKINKKDILVVIPARSGSKGIPGKNIKKLHGKPLINYTIEAAKEIFENSQVIVSTDDKEIAEIAASHGANIPFLRPKELAQDDSSTRDVILHLVDYFERQKSMPSVIVLLQVTSPIRNSKHLNEALDLFFHKDCDMVVSVTESKTSPYFNLYEENKEGYLQKSKDGAFTRRQDVPPVYEYNGAIYIFKTKSIVESEMKDFEKITKYVMSKNDSVDIDDEVDWKIAEYILTK
ncbi:MAG: cytidylyltransferase domain-containing protein [Crocinitomicaceae bacterium]